MTAPGWTFTRAQLIAALGTIKLHPMSLTGGPGNLISAGALADAILAQMPPAAMEAEEAPGICITAASLLTAAKRIAKVVPAGALIRVPAGFGKLEIVGADGTRIGDIDAALAVATVFELPEILAARCLGITSGDPGPRLEPKWCRECWGDRHVWLGNCWGLSHAGGTMNGCGHSCHEGEVWTG